MFIEDGKKQPIIDVRSPGEYQKGHIPGAINLPIFNDLERARVGTIYKQQNKDDAMALGLEIVGPKLSNFADQAKNLAVNGALNVYCWRGGMRSEKMAWLFELAGIKVNVLQNGYKSYRKFLHRCFQLIDQLIVIQGPTGSGKTKILSSLKEAGEQVIDLEGLANHKGSAFGGLGEEEQPTTQQFQNNILATLLAFNLAQPVWIESESLTIGRVYLPEELWLQMNEATVIALDVPREYRISHIVEQYGVFSVEELSAKIRQLEQSMGNANMSMAIDLVGEGDLPGAVGILLNYYDQSYAHSASKHKLNRPVTVSLSSADPDDNAKTLMDKVMEISS